MKLSERLFRVWFWFVLSGISLYGLSIYVEGVWDVVLAFIFGILCGMMIATYMILVAFRSSNEI